MCAPDIGAHGDVPESGAGQAGDSFLSLATLDLSGNEITVIEGPPPSSLQTVRLRRNNLTALYDSTESPWGHLAPESSWYDVPYLDVRDNPQLYLDVDAADSQRRISLAAATASLEA